MARSIIGASLALVSALLATQQLPAGQPAPPPACSGAEFHQFDFWIGDWDVLTADGKVAGHNRVESIANGCGIMSWALARFSPPASHIGRVYSHEHAGHFPEL